MLYGTTNLTNLTNYYDDELVNWVENEEFLYERRTELTRDDLEEIFVFTDAQWDTFVEYQEDEIEDLENEEVD